MREAREEVLNLYPLSFGGLEGDINRERFTAGPGYVPGSSSGKAPALNPRDWVQILAQVKIFLLTYNLSGESLLI